MQYLIRRKKFIIFCIGMIALYISLLYCNDKKEQPLAMTSFFLSLGLILLLIAIDKIRRFFA